MEDDDDEEEEGGDRGRQGREEEDDDGDKDEDKNSPRGSRSDSDSGEEDDSMGERCDQSALPCIWLSGVSRTCPHCKKVKRPQDWANHIKTTLQEKREYPHRDSTTLEWMGSGHTHALVEGLIDAAGCTLKQLKALYGEYLVLDIKRYYLINLFPPDPPGTEVDLYPEATDSEINEAYKSLLEEYTDWIKNPEGHTYLPLRALRHKLEQGVGNGPPESLSIATLISCGFDVDRIEACPEGNLMVSVAVDLDPPPEEGQIGEKDNPEGCGPHVRLGLFPQILLPESPPRVMSPTRIAGLAGIPDYVDARTLNTTIAPFVDVLAVWKLGRGTARSQAVQALAYVASGQDMRNLRKLCQLELLGSPPDIPEEEGWSLTFTGAGPTMVSSRNAPVNLQKRFRKEANWQIFKPLGEPNFTFPSSEDLMWFLFPEGEECREYFGYPPQDAEEGVTYLIGAVGQDIEHHRETWESIGPFLKDFSDLKNQSVSHFPRITGDTYDEEGHKRYPPDLPTNLLDQEGQDYLNSIIDTSATTLLVPAEIELTGSDRIYRCLVYAPTCSDRKIGALLLAAKHSEGALDAAMDQDAPGEVKPPTSPRKLNPPPDQDLQGRKGKGKGKPKGSIKMSKFKSELCITFQRQGSCPHGECCTFAHDRSELQPLEPPIWAFHPTGNTPAWAYSCTSSELYDTIRGLQQSHPGVQAAWTIYCDSEYDGTKDPRRHKDKSIFRFLSGIYKDEESLGTPPDLSGKVGKGSGKKGTPQQSAHKGSKGGGGETGPTP